MKKKPQSTPSFAETLASQRRAWRFTQQEMGERFGVSKKTELRWELGERVPAPRETTHVLRRAMMLDGAFAERLAAALGTSLVAEGLAPKPPAAPAPGSDDAATAARGRFDPPTARAHVDAALLATAEALDVSPRKLRSAVASLLRRLAELGVRMEDAAALVASKS